MGEHIFRDLKPLRFKIIIRILTLNKLLKKPNKLDKHSDLNIVEFEFGLIKNWVIFGTHIQN